MKALFTIILLFIVACIAKAQYPFEKYPAVKHKKYENWVVEDTNAARRNPDDITLQKSIPGFFGKESLVLRAVNKNDDNILELYKGKQLLQRIDWKIFMHELNSDEPIIVADFNGDGMKDVRLMIPTMGCGLASLNVYVVYLFQKKGNKFTAVNFFEKEGAHSVERDMNGDGNYEIITGDLQGYESHNYWLYNVYNFKNDALVCVNDQFNYPIMIQYLFRENYKPAKFSKSILSKYAQKLPQEYEVIKAK